MIFTEALKKEVFGTATKNSRLANTKIVERATELYRPPSLLNAVKEITGTHDELKTSS